MPTERRAHNGHNGSGPDAAAALADLGAERALLGAVLAEPRRLADIEATLRYDDFADPLHEEVYGLICRMRARGADIDVVTVAAEAGRERLAGYEGAHQLRAMVTDLPDAAHIASYLAIVRDLGRRRRLVGAGLDVRRAALDSATPTGEAQERARTLLAAAVADTGDGDMVSLGDAVDEWLRDMATPLAERPMGLSTGLRDLDTLLLGGVRPSDLVILAGRPAMGKSSALVGMARAAALAGASVVLFSLEMPRKQMVMRMLSIETGVPLPDVWRADPSSPYHRALCAGAERLKGYIGRCAIYDRPRATVGEMARLAARVQERDGLGLVMVDYLQRVTGGGQESRVQEVAAIAADLKTMARELDVPVVALSQVNRAVEARAEHRPGMADLSESGNVERESDVVIFLYREHYYTKQPDVETRAEAIVAKQRNGPTGTVQLEWTPALTRFSSAPQAGSPPSAPASPAVTGAPSAPDFAVAADAHTYDF